MPDELGEAEGGEAEGEGIEDYEEEEDAQLDAVKQKAKEMEDEAENLRKIQEQTIEEQLNGGEGAGEGEGAASEEVDSRSVYIGQVDYSATPEELQEHFAGCGTINRVTILCDKYHNSKGFAYVEFAEVEAVAQAVLLNESEFKGRQLKVTEKRTNVHGFGKGGKGKGKGKGGYSPGKGKGKGKGGWGYKGKGGPYYRPKSYGGRGFRPY